MIKNTHLGFFFKVEVHVVTEHIGDLNLNFLGRQFIYIYIYIIYPKCLFGSVWCECSSGFQQFSLWNMFVDLRIHLYSFMSLSGITAAYKADLLFWERFQKVKALQGCEHVLASMPMEMRRHWNKRQTESVPPGKTGIDIYRNCI